MMVPPLDNGQYRLHATCLRFEDPKNPVPRIHHNSSHITAGIDKIEVRDDGDLRIYLTNYPDGTTGAILSGVINPDETFSMSGWSVGFSGGVGHADLRFSKNGKRYKCTHPNFYSKYCNLWVSFYTTHRDHAASLDYCC
ncbi:hypothetical protein SAMN05216266_101475 [Amycolatopsis marina]|uniref:Uncharacterized protein n=1 Tax=Amycolatopsis marina TaxID=490629 RepID=A0A1I0VSY4_9PSEU|nr:hypothetical protein [Amycolatopsis marina]SFA79501.1 hypothetical protein SAMN05216266_101475 [Amycolatopsis marina]